jgi:hypothetical protein
MPDDTDSGRNDDSEGREVIAREIVTYLLKHPDAKDTLDGILEWWLAGGRARTSRRRLEDALDDLALRGWVNSERRGPEVVLYGLNKAKSDEMVEHLIKNNQYAEPPGNTFGG